MIYLHDATTWKVAMISVESIACIIYIVVLNSMPASRRSTLASSPAAFAQVESLNNVPSTDPSAGRDRYARVVYLALSVPIRTAVFVVYIPLFLYRCPRVPFVAATFCVARDCQFAFA